MWEGRTVSRVCGRLPTLSWSASSMSSEGEDSGSRNTSWKRAVGEGERAVAGADRPGALLRVSASGISCPRTKSGSQASSPGAAPS